MGNLIQIIAEDGLTSASFLPERGGLCVSLVMPNAQRKDKKGEILYVPSSGLSSQAKIEGGFPFCFPICGRLNRDGQKGVYLFAGKRYEMDIHGFAHRYPWDVLYHEKRKVGMRFSSNEETMKSYPFEFQVELHYEIQNGQLRCTYRIENLNDEQVLPYYAGFHPYFLIDPAFYQKDQVFLCAEVSGEFFYNQDLDDVMDSNEDAKTLMSPLSNPDMNEKLFFFEQAAGFELHFPDRLIIGVDIENMDGEESSSFPFMQLYHEPKEPFFCVEPWMSHPNAMNTQFAARVLFPGEFEESGFTLTAKIWD